MQFYLTILLLSSLTSNILAYPSNRLLKRDGEGSRQLSEEGKEMICRLNALRRENGKKDILLDYRVMEAAQKHASAMKQNDNLTHDGFTAETKEFMDRVHLEGYTGGAGAENICQGSGNVVDVLTCWKNSPGHLENMLSDNECFGYGRDDFFWVQDFVSGDKCQGYGDIDCTPYSIDQGLSQSSGTSSSQPEYKKLGDEKSDEKPNTPASGNGNLGEEDIEMICRVNEVRRRAGKGPVKYDTRIKAAAQKHAEAMKEHQSLRHEGFTEETQGFMDRAVLEGFPTNSAGTENVASGMGTVKEAVDAWINSKGHYENMISDTKCFGYGKSDMYWSQTFALKEGEECNVQESIDCSKFGF